MAQRRKTKPKSAAPIDGVLLQLLDVDGAQRLKVQALGTTRVTEVPTLLRLGAQLAEKDLGIEGG